MNSEEKFDQCFILHGCPPSETNVLPKSKRWMNWLELQLQQQGLKAVAPDMPTPWHPVYREWKDEFDRYIVTENSILVGHSCGAAFLVQWLLETGKQVKKLILVAPAKIPETPDDARGALYDFTFPSQVPLLAQEIVLFTSNDFPHHLQALEIYKKALNPHPRIIYLENKGHYLIFTMGTDEFPELLEEVLC